MDFNNIPTGLILSILIRAIWIIVFFGFIQHFLLKLIRNERLHDRVKFYNPIFRNIAWVLFAISVTYQLARINPVVSLAVVGVLLALGWQSIRDFIQGTIFKLQRGDIHGQRLTVESYSGIVKKMYNTKLELSTRDGKLIQIPYSHIISTVTTKPTATRHLKTGSVFIDLPEGKNMEEVKNELKEKLLNLPWVVSGKGVKIEATDDNKQLKIIFSTLNRAYVERVRRLLLS